MIKLVGLMDYDALIQKKYTGPNYDLGVTYAWLKTDPNINVRLIASLEDNNLKKYNEILIFKLSPYLAHPSGTINNYYTLPIKEFGEGFLRKSIRPYYQQTRYIKPDFTCYNNIIKLSIDKPKHELSWDLSRATKVKNPQHLKLYEDIDGELLRKDINNLQRDIVLHDNPNYLLNSAERYQTILDLLQNGHRLFFKQPLDISMIKDTNILEQVITQSNLASLRNNLIITNMNDSALWFINYYIKHKCKKTDVLVLYEKGKNVNYYFRSALLLNYYNNKTGYLLRLRPYWDKTLFLSAPLAHYAYRFLYEKPFLMSFYEYVFYLGCAKNGIPKKYVKTNDESYEYIMRNYGMPDIIQELEEWMEKNPECEEQIFIGGSSKYEKSRRKYYDIRRSGKAFRGSVNDFS